MTTAIQKRGMKQRKQSKIIPAYGQLPKMALGKINPSRLARLFGEAPGTVGQNYLGPSPADMTESVLFYDFECHSLPLTTNEFNNLFNAERSVLGCGNVEEDDTACVRRTNINCDTSFQCPFLMTGLCVVAIADSELFTVNGVFNAAQPAVNSEIPNIPPVDTAEQPIHPQGSGLVADTANIAPAGAWSGAKFGHGWPALRALEHYMLTTRFDLVICNKLLVVSELLSSMGMCLMSPAFQGAGDSYIDSGPFIRCVNETMQDKALGVFLTVNRADDEAQSCLPAPVVKYIKGATVFPGVTGKPYMLNQPIFLGPGMGSRFNFINTTDEDCICPLQSILTVTTQSPHPNYLQDVAQVTASCGNDTFVPGGQMCIGLLLFGYEMSPMAVAAWLQRMIAVGSPQLSGIRELQQTLEGQTFLGRVVQEATQKRENRRQSVVNPEVITNWLSGIGVES